MGSYNTVKNYETLMAEKWRGQTEFKNKSHVSFSTEHCKHYSNPTGKSCVFKYSHMMVTQDKILFRGLHCKSLRSIGIARQDQNQGPPSPISCSDLPCLVHLDCISSTWCIVAPVPFNGGLADDCRCDSQQEAPAHLQPVGMLRGLRLCILLDQGQGNKPQHQGIYSPVSLTCGCRNLQRPRNLKGDLTIAGQTFSDRSVIFKLMGFLHTK